MLFVEKITAGKTAIVYRISETHVAKLYRRHISLAQLEHERAAMALAHAQGISALLPGALIEHDGKRGFSMPLVHGPTGMERIYSGADTEQEACLLAALQAQLHKASGAGLLPIRDRLLPRLQHPNFSGQLRTKLLSALNRLPDGASLLHGDFHPGNLCFTESGPVVLDWADAAQGTPVFDVARCLVLFGWGVTTDQNRNTFTRAYLAEYQRITGSVLSHLSDALLVCRAARLFEEAAENPAALRALIEQQ